MDWREESVRATFVLLVASIVLIGPGLAGIGSSPVIVVALLVLAVGLFALRTRVPDGPTVLHRDLGAYGRIAWAGPAVAAAVCLAFLNASPAELRALGGLVGLLGMANYFLRPVYRVGSALFRRVAGT